MLIYTWGIGYGSRLGYQWTRNIGPFVYKTVHFGAIRLTMPHLYAIYACGSQLLQRFLAIIRTLTLPFQWKLPYPLYACNKIDTLWHFPFNRTKAKDQGMLGIPAKSPICRWTIGNHWQPLAHFERGHLHTPLTWSWPDLNLAVGPGGSRCSWLWFGYDLL
jgi:hypothetical protein